jgi:hypothetical protein
VAIGRELQEKIETTGHVNKSVEKEKNLTNIIKMASN